ncbi:hypothetical protein H0W80_02830 [Candidatus Saccharibacteria bacterium]|nr:hypothetical protein [Candidatus Saccharibacteria bacterium]
MATSVQDFLKQNPNYIGYANTANRTAPSQAPKGKKGSGNQGWLSSIISELGGAGGAAGGTAIGATLGSVVPGAGTLAGGILGGAIGGFTGGFGGRAIENKVRDNEYRVGDSLKEGAISGVFGGAGAAFQGARGAYAAGKAAGFGGEGIGATMKAGSGLIDDAGAKAGRAVISKGAKAGKAVGQGLVGTDDFMRATDKGVKALGNSARGFNRSTTIPGYKGLKPADARKVNATLDGVSKWFSGIGKSAQFTNLDDATKALANEYALSPESKQAFKHSKTVLDAFKKNVAGNPSISSNLDEGVKNVNAKLVKNLEKATKGFKTNDDFLKYMSEVVNPRYKELRGAATMGSKETQIYEAFRRSMKSVLDDNLATKSGINKRYTDLLKADDLLQDAITKDISSGAGQGMNVGRSIANVVGPGLDIAGRGMQQAGKVTQYTTPVLAKALSRGAVNSSTTAPMDQAKPDGMGSEAPQEVYGGAGVMDSKALYGAGNFTGGAAGMDGQMGEPNGGQQYDPYAPENVRASITQIMQQGGDQKDVKEFLSVASSLGKMSGGTGAGGPNITKVTGQQYQLATRGATAVDQLEQLLSSDPNVLKRSATAGRKLPIVGGFISNAAGTGDFDAIGYNVASSLLRIETGAQANPEEIKNLQSQMMPRAGDSTQTVQTKLAQLRQAFSGILNTANGNFGQSNESSLAQSIGGY